jgi:hypothetical protein
LILKCPTSEEWDILRMTEPTDKRKCVEGSRNASIETTQRYARISNEFVWRESERLFGREVDKLQPGPGSSLKTPSGESQFSAEPGDVWLIERDAAAPGPDRATARVGSSRTEQFIARRGTIRGRPARCR